MDEDKDDQIARKYFERHKQLKDHIIGQTEKIQQELVTNLEYVEKQQKKHRNVDKQGNIRIQTHN